MFGDIGAMCFLAYSFGCTSFLFAKTGGCTTMKCPKCKTEIDDNSITCSNCGFDIGLYKEAYSEINKKKLYNLDSEEKTCPECGLRVDSTADSCPDCGYPFISQNNQSQDNKKSNRNIKKKVIIVISVVLVGIAIWYAWFASTRCAWSGCFEHKASNSSYCTYHKNYLSGYSSNYSSNSLSSSKSKFDLRITNIDIDTNSAATYCTGTITNNGNSTFKFVKVKGSFKDNSGNTIETGDSYAVGSEGLSPGESTSFRISCSRNTRVKDCDVTIYDYD